jgi:hypothetical protein
MPLFMVEPAEMLNRLVADSVVNAPVFGVVEPMAGTGQIHATAAAEEAHVTGLPKL